MHKLYTFNVLNIVQIVANFHHVSPSIELQYTADRVRIEMANSTFHRRHDRPDCDTQFGTLSISFHRVYFRCSLINQKHRLEFIVASVRCVAIYYYKKENKWAEKKITVNVTTEISLTVAIFPHTGGCPHQNMSWERFVTRVDTAQYEIRFTMMRVVLVILASTIQKSASEIWQSKSSIIYSNRVVHSARCVFSRFVETQMFRCLVLNATNIAQFMATKNYMFA